MNLHVVVKVRVPPRAARLALRVVGALASTPPGSPTIPAMDYGLVLPAMGDGSTREGLEAAGELAERHGFGEVWGTDHVLVARAAADDYGRIYEIFTTLAWLAGRFR